MIELYHWEPTYNSAEVLIGLAEKGIDFESRYVDLLRFEQHRPDFLALNPEGQVPVLVHDGRVLTETGFILQYLDDEFPAVSLMPETAADRYWVQVWAKYANEYFAPAISVLGWHTSMAPTLAADWRAAAEPGLERLPSERRAIWRTALTDAYSEEQLAAARRSLVTRIEKAEERLGRSEWLAGDRYSVADITIYPLAATLPGLVPDLVNPTATPRLVAWLETVRDRPAVQHVLATSRSGRPEAMFAPGPEGGRWG